MLQPQAIRSAKRRTCRPATRYLVTIGRLRLGAGTAPRERCAASGAVITLQFLHAQVAELDARAMPEKADRRLGALGDGLQAFDLGDVGIDDDDAVDRHHPARALDLDFFGVPFAGGLGVAALGRYLAVDRAVILARLDVLVLGSVVVEDLDFVAAHGDAVIAARLEAEIEAEGEVAVFLDGEQVTAPLFLAHEQAVFGRVAVRGALPAGQGLAVENADETGLVLGRDVGFLVLPGA